MDLTLTDDEELIATTARELLEARCSISHVREMEVDPMGYSPELWQEMAGLGWTGLVFPEEHDGAGASFLMLCLIIEQMGRVQLPSPFVASVVLAGMAIAEHGSADQQAQLLGAVSRGERILSYARAAPGSGWEQGGSSVRARARGESLVLDGTAMFVPYAAAADALVVVAQEGDDVDALTALVVATDADGVSVDRLETVAGHQHRVTFDAVEVGGDGVIGGRSRGGEIVASVDARGAAATCAEMVGGAQRVLDMTVEYAKDRQQFDTPIGAFQAVQHHCANMGVDVLSARLIAYEAIWRISEGLDAREEVSMAKAWVTEAYRRVCSLGHQVHGAIGFTEEHELHHYFRHSVAAGLAFGDGDHHWEQVAQHLGLSA